MTLLELARLNIRHNFRRYAIYLFAMIFCVFTTQTFFTLMMSESVARELSLDISLQKTFLSFSVVMIVFTLFFLISSNNSFIRARKKEISTYALFGMTQMRIGRLMLIEVLLLGIAALFTGILLSMFFSKLLVMILLKISLAAYSGNIAFRVEPITVAMTAVTYAAIFAVMGLSGFRVIGKFQLTDLFKAEKVSEKQSKGSLGLMILAVVMIFTGYFLSAFGPGRLISGLMVPIVGLVVLGSYLFFWSGFNRLLVWLKKRQRKQNDGIGMTAAALSAHKSRTAATMMATISILIAIGTTSIAVGYTLYRNAEQQTYENTGFDLVYAATHTSLVHEVSDILEANDAKISDQVTYRRYHAKVALSGIPVSRQAQVADQSDIEFCAVSQYNAIINATRDKNQAVMVAPGHVYLIDAAYGYLYQNEENESWMNAEVNLDGERLVVTDFSKKGYDFGQTLVAVLEDEDFNRLLANGDISESSEVQYVGLNYVSALRRSDVAEELSALLAARTNRYTLAYEEYNQALSTYGLVFFIGFFMCVVFILMTASTLYFKQMTMAAQEKTQFGMLRKLGVDTQTEKIIVFRKLLPVFLLPLLLGVLHSVFAMKAADAMVFDNIISAANTFQVVLKYSSVMYLVYALIYGVFFFITKKQYYQTVRKTSHG